MLKKNKASQKNHCQKKRKSINFKIILISNHYRLSIPFPFLNTMESPKRRSSARLRRSTNIPQPIHTSTPDSANTSLANRSANKSDNEKPAHPTGPKKRPSRARTSAQNDHDHRMVRFRYIQRQDARLGFTTREISVEFSDEEDEEAERNDETAEVKSGRKKSGKVKSRKPVSKTKAVDLAVKKTKTTDETVSESWVGKI